MSALDEEHRGELRSSRLRQHWMRSAEASLGASYAVHPNMMSNTGGVMSHGHGIIYTQSSKLKLITMSSAAVESAGAYVNLCFRHWTEWPFETKECVESMLLILDRIMCNS